MEESPVNQELHEQFGRAATGLEEPPPAGPSPIDRVRAHVERLGARLDEPSLRTPWDPAEPVLVLARPEDRASEPREAFEARMIDKAQRLARTLRQPIGLHVIPSWDFPGMLERDFHGHAVFVVPDVLRDAGIADDPNAARSFLRQFGETMFDKLGHGRWSRQRDPGTPSVPIVLFIRLNIQSRELSEQYFVYNDVNLFPRNVEHFTERLAGIYHWRFEDLDGRSEEAVRRRLVEGYLDKLLELAGSATGLEERDGAMGRDLAVAAWQGVPSMAAGLEASARSAVLVFHDHLDLAALAVQQGLAVAVPVDGPEASGLEELLARMPEPKGAYAIGAQASARFLQDYAETSRIAIETRPQFFALVGLEEDRLLAPVRQALTATRDFLDLAA